MGTRGKTRRPPRRHHTIGALGLALLLAGCSTDSAEDEPPVPHQTFISRPDLKPAELKFTQGPAWEDTYATAEEYVLLTPNFDTETPSSAATILDAAGNIVWMDPSGEHDDDAGHFDLRVQEYRGEPVLTYFKGPAAGGWGYGDIYLMDSSYQVFTTVTTGGSLPPHSTDFHDMTITDDDTMLVLAYVAAPADLSALGGPEAGWVHDAVVQEIDIETGQVTFEWSALDHVPVTDTMLDFDEELQRQQDRLDEGDEHAKDGELGTRDNPYDYFHINSATVDHDGGLLLSARHTHAVYKIDRDTGALDWILGGTASDFTMDDDAVFAWQHAAARDDDGTLVLLDNHARNADDDQSSRGLRLTLDEEAMTASVHTEYRPPAERPAGSMANLQLLENGNVVIGWGQQPFFSEYTRDGELIYDVCHGAACHGGDDGGGSYRAYKAAWEGHPTTQPRVVIQENASDDRHVYVSWNGATEVAQWRLLAGADEASATEQVTVDKESFETSLPLSTDSDYVAVEALDSDGHVLATGVATADSR